MSNWEELKKLVTEFVSIGIEKHNAVEKRVSGLERDSFSNMVARHEVTGALIIDNRLVEVVQQIMWRKDSRLSKLETAVNEFMVEVREKLDPMISAMAISSIHKPDFSHAPTNAEAQDQVGRDMTRATHGPGQYIDEFGDRHPLKVFTPLGNWADRYFHGADPVESGATKMASATCPDPGVAYVAGEGHFGLVPYHIAIDRAASPKNLPFEIALAYIKAGRSVARAAHAHLTHKEAAHIINGALVGEAFMSGLAALGDLTATDWYVLAEEPQKP